MTRPRIDFSNLTGDAAVTYLLTRHNTVVCLDQAWGRLVHIPIGERRPGTIRLDIGPVEAALAFDIGHLLRDDAGLVTLELTEGALAGWTLRRSGVGQALHLFCDRQELVAEAGTAMLRAARDHDGDGAGFLAIGEADLDALTDMLAANWLVQVADAPMVPERARMAGNFLLRIGTVEADLRWNLPFDLASWPHRMVLLREGWRAVPVFRYRPLVCFVAYGDEDVLTQFALSVASLLSVGDYDGEIAVFTDRSPSEIAALMPADCRLPVTIVPLQAVDRIGYLSARLGLTVWPGASDYQPLLYADADILFDLPVMRVLCEVAMAGHICAVPERHLLAGSPFFGGDLLAADGFVPDPLATGFNSGTLGIPNMARHRSTLALVVRVLSNRLAICGRSSVSYVDQPIFNYVAFRTDAFDTALLGRHVRLCDQHAQPEDRVGLAHFCWVPGAALRVTVMREYLERLLAPGRP